MTDLSQVFRDFCHFIGDSKIVRQLLINENQYCEIIHQLGELFVYSMNTHSSFQP
jgi:hypothetical protein